MLPTRLTQEQKTKIKLLVERGYSEEDAELHVMNPWQKFLWWCAQALFLIVLFGTAIVLIFASYASK